MNIKKMFVKVEAEIETKSGASALVSITPEIWLDNSEDPVTAIQSTLDMCFGEIERYGTLINKNVKTEAEKKPVSFDGLFEEIKAETKSNPFAAMLDD